MNKYCKYYPVAVLFLVFLVILAVGCSNDEKHQQTAAKRDSQAASAKPEKKTAVRANVTNAKDQISANSGKKSEPTDSSKSDQQETTKKEKPKRLIIYKGVYSLLVDSVKDTVKLIEDLTKKYNGFIDKMSSSDAFRQAEIIMRVPVKHFEDAIADVAKLGIVESKNISASDVTEEYYDTLLRMSAAKKILTRMQELLKKVSKPEERIKILKEIERLSSKIATMENRVQYLRSQADFSTIIINLKTKIRERQKKYIPSPFQWIRSIDANNPPNYEVDKDFKFSKPDGFFLREKEYRQKEANFLLVNPGNSAKLRLGIVENYPKADVLFWSQALELDAKNRKYEKVKGIEISLPEINFAGTIYKISQDRIFLVAVSVNDDKIMVLEGLFQDEKVYQENNHKLRLFLESVRW